MDQLDGARRILVVDDDPDIAQVVKMTLEEEGFDVSVACSAKDAFEKMAKEGLPHLAVVDIRMPGTDGLELARKVQKYSDLPVIMLTAVNEEDTVVKAIEEVAEDYVTKPFVPKVLAARVKRVMRRMGDFAFRLDALTVIDDRLAILQQIHQHAEADFRGRARQHRATAAAATRLDDAGLRKALHDLGQVVAREPQFLGQFGRGFLLGLQQRHGNQNRNDH